MNKRAYPIHDLYFLYFDYKNSSEEKWKTIRFQRNRVKGGVHFSLSTTLGEEISSKIWRRIKKILNHSRYFDVSKLPGVWGFWFFFYSNVNAFYQLSHFPVVFIKFRRFHGGIPGFPVEWEPCNKTKSMSMGNSLFFFGPVGKCDSRFWLSNAWEMTSILWEANSFPHVDFQN